MTTAQQCPITGKRGYPSERAAKIANRNNGTDLRAYRCPDCHRYHVATRSGG